MHLSLSVYHYHSSIILFNSLVHGILFSILLSCDIDKIKSSTWQSGGRWTTYYRWLDYCCISETNNHGIMIWREWVRYSALHDLLLLIIILINYNEMIVNSYFLLWILYSNQVRVFYVKVAWPFRNWDEA